MELCSQITGGWSCPRMSLLSRLDATIDSWMPLTDTHQKQSLSGFWKKLELSAYVGYISTKIIFPCKIHQCISVPKVKSWHVDEVVGLGYVMICTCFLMHELLIKTMRKISPSFISLRWEPSNKLPIGYCTCTYSRCMKINQNVAVLNETFSVIVVSPWLYLASRTSRLL